MSRALPQEARLLAAALALLAWVVFGGFLAQAGHAVCVLSGGFVSGHSLRHVAAPWPVRPVILAGWGPADSRVQNARQLPIRAA